MYKKIYNIINREFKKVVRRKDYHNEKIFWNRWN